MLSITRKNKDISKYFYDHQEDVALCFEKFEKFFEILFKEGTTKEELESAKVCVENAEGAADKELRHVVDAMSGSFLPATRKTLIKLVQSTDEIANTCEEIVRQIVLEKIDVPATLRPDMLKIIEITEGQLEILFKAIDKMLNDYKTLDKNRKILDDIRQEESRVDAIEAMLHARIFDLDISLTEKVYYKDLLEKVCDISDTIEDVSDQIQVLLVEREG